MMSKFYVESEKLGKEEERIPEEKGDPRQFLSEKTLKRTLWG